MAVVLAPAPAQTSPAPRRWTPDEFARMQAAGLFGKTERVELRGGEVYVNGRLKSWTTDEYYRLLEAGALHAGEKVELVQGRIWEKLPINPPHMTAMRNATKQMEAAFGNGCEVRPQGPLTLPNGSAPEPDVLVVRGNTVDFAFRHPVAAEALLVIEISDATLAFDRGEEMRAYASAGITEYWVLDLNARQLEVYRGPSEAGYADVTVYGELESVAPLAVSQSPVIVAELLPLSQTS